jgi:hypothetical protein
MIGKSYVRIAAHTDEAENMTEECLNIGNAARPETFTSFSETPEQFVD